MQMKKKSLAGLLLALFLIVIVPSAFASKPSGVEFIDLIKEKVPNYEVNDQGQTYGQGPFEPGVSQEPDLIKVVGDNGVKGYVKSSDLNPSFNSPEEALKYQNTPKSNKIPIYKSDGKTIIGEFSMTSH
ncbi:hypothetical protein [Paenibacillus sp. MSJ-34]|uniref:hypothetical protein n=1 Tax=Paenibacillus sp. MSJ-34 TaxID=2841529 RepID=UPI001C121E38|nr:hypothetical protein [Paenibacillus sp. MSJ-34]MBU5442749.1 hypothetical protein [Paenibacillus sp. MSJ-34]